MGSCFHVIYKLMKYYLIAGEASGDLYGSQLINEIKNLDHDAQFRYWGGDLMKGQGGDLVKHYKDHNFMGFLEVIINLKSILKNIKFCKKDILDNKPDALILIDFPGFNMRIAKFIKSHTRIPVLYFIAPQVWAWKESRVKKIRKYIDKLFVILPFEKKYFNSQGIEVSYNGHPLVEYIERFINENALSKEEFYSRYELDHKKENIILLPGSREQEIEKKLPIMLNACKHREDQFNIIIGGIRHLKSVYYKIGLESNVSIIYNDTYNILNHSRVAFVTSGTATLETAFFNVPQIVCYKSSWISYLIAKMLVKVKYISLVNLILNKETVKELIQSDLSALNLKNNLDNILDQKSHLETILHDYKALKKLCQGNNVPKLTAREMLKTISG